MTKILYISYDGMTDPLGQSQVIPYLIGLSEKGYKFHLISCEKKENFLTGKDPIAHILASHGVEWRPIPYTKWPPVFSTLWDIMKIKRKAISIYNQEKIDIVHCRSYIASIIGLWMKKKMGVKFIFDMRGFWADERVEGGLWNTMNPFFKIIYSYFKKKEKDFLAHADYTISLTEAAKKEIHSWMHIPNQPLPIQVIPCCVNTEFFNPDKIDKEQQKIYKNKLGINDSDLVLSYLGALGTWYLLDEMLLFFKQLLTINFNSKFLFITHEKRETIFKKTKELNIDPEKIIVYKAKRNEVPILLSFSSLSIFFIQPVFSKKASSPTKMGEIMSMGIPFICNSAIGDVEQIINKTNAGILINKLSENEFNTALQQLDMLLVKDKAEIRKSAETFFSLEGGVKTYDTVYRLLSN